MPKHAANPETSFDLEGIELEHTACFAGPRPRTLFPHADDPFSEDLRPACSRVVCRLQGVVEDLHKRDGIDCFVTGGAQGFDQLAFWAVNAAKRRNPEIKSVVFVPFCGQQDKWHRVGMFGQGEYAKMLSHADAVYICDRDINVESAHRPAIAKRLLSRNCLMVDVSSVVVGQYAEDGWRDPSSSPRSGTAATLRYAEQSGKRLIVSDFRL